MSKNSPFIAPCPCTCLRLPEGGIGVHHLLVRPVDFPASKHGRSAVVQHLRTVSPWGFYMWGSSTLLHEELDEVFPPFSGPQWNVTDHFWATCHGNRMKSVFSGVPARHGGSPNWMVDIGKYTIKMDDLGVTLWLRKPPFLLATGHILMVSYHLEIWYGDMMIWKVIRVDL